MESKQVNSMVEPVKFVLPKRPRVMRKDPPPDQRKVAVVPIRAVFDKKLTHGGLQALAALCSYCNRAGVTWVSQTRLAQELGITQQAVAKQFKQLKELGYLEVMRRGFKGERTDTLRVIFDPSITGEDAIAMTSGPKEDTRPPAIREEQERAARAAQEQPDPEGQRRIAELVRAALQKSMINNQPKEYTMPKTETRTVREMKAKMRKPVDKTVDTGVDSVGITKETTYNQEVVKQATFTTSGTKFHNLEVVHNTENTINKVIRLLSTTNLKKLEEAGMKPEEVDQAYDTLTELFAAEGVQPSEAVMTDAILQLHMDAKT